MAVPGSEKRSEQKKGIDITRRQFLKMAALGSGAFLVFKGLNYGFGLFSEGPVLTERLFEAFRVTETEKSLTFFDRGSGKEILIIEK